MNTKTLTKAGKGLIATIEGRPVGYVYIIRIPCKYSYFRISRIVVLPDYQGVGIGKRLLNVAGEYCEERKKLPLYLITSNPQFKHLAGDRWRLTRCGRSIPTHETFMFKTKLAAASSGKRITMTYKYRPKSYDEFQT